MPSMFALRRGEVPNADNLDCNLCLEPQQEALVLEGDDGDTLVVCLSCLRAGLRFVRMKEVESDGDAS